MKASRDGTNENWAFQRLLSNVFFEKQVYKPPYVIALYQEMLAAIEILLERPRKDSGV